MITRSLFPLALALALALVAGACAAPPEIRAPETSVSPSASPPKATEPMGTTRAPFASIDAYCASIKASLPVPWSGPDACGKPRFAGPTEATGKGAIIGAAVIERPSRTDPMNPVVVLALRTPAGWIAADDHALLQQLDGPWRIHLASEALTIEDGPEPRVVFRYHVTEYQSSTGESTEERRRLTCSLRPGDRLSCADVR